MESVVLLVDIDGTICEDIPNEESHRFPTAKPIEGAASYYNSKYDGGHTLVYFTAREEKDREATMLWLMRHGFKHHALIMNKPRSLGRRYAWIDNVPVLGVHFRGSFQEVEECLQPYVSQT